MTFRTVPAPSEINEVGSHIPVMLAEMLATLRPRDGAVYLDGTFGAGGYASALLGLGVDVIALDRDPAGISTGEVARLLGRQHRELSMARQALIDEHRLLRAAGQGRLEFSIPLFENWLQQQLASATAPDFVALLPKSDTRPRPLDLDANPRAKRSFSLPPGSALSDTPRRSRPPPSQRGPER